MQVTSGPTTISTEPEREAPYLHADEPQRGRRHGWWWKALLVGALLWLVTIVVTVLTGNPNLVPTLILIGSFLVPFCVVLFAAERLNPAFGTGAVMVAFFVGGVLGVLGASLLEAPLGGAALGLLVVGFVEELVKAAVLMLMGRGLVPKTARQGALLGATVGAGFAAFESAGYAFNAALAPRGIDLISLLQTEGTRAVLTPLGHVLWTGVLGAAVFAASRDGRRYRITWVVVGVYVLVSVLHGLWDSMSTIATVIAFALTGNLVPAFTMNAIHRGTAAEVSALSTGFYLVGLGVVSVVGGLVLMIEVRRHRPRDRSMSEEHAPAA